MNADAVIVLFAIVGGFAGSLLGALIAWHLLVAIVRLLLAWHMPQAVEVLLERLAVATIARQPWEPVLRGLRLRLPWPWPWRLQRAAQQLRDGRTPAEVLAHGRLLPTVLRAQAVRALVQGPEAFFQWTLAVRGRSRHSPLLVRQGAILLAEALTVIAFMHFLCVTVLPLWDRLSDELNLTPSWLLRGAGWFAAYELPILLAISLAVIGTAGMSLAWGWRMRRRAAEARLLLAGSDARVPEAALGAGDDFAALCAAAGWQADSPAALARAVMRADLRQRRRAAWLPALCAALGPLLLAVPVGAVVIGIMQMLIGILMQMETMS